MASLSVGRSPVLGAMEFESDPIYTRFTKEQSIWQRIQESWVAPSYLKNQLKRERNVPLHTIIKAFSSEDYTYLRSTLRKAIVNVIQEGRIEDLFRKIVLKNASEKHFKLIERCLELFSHEEIQACIQTKFPDFNVEKQQKTDAIIYHALHRAVGDKIPEQGFNLLRIVYGVIDTLAMAFSFFEIGKDPGSSFEATHMFEVYATLCLFPLTVFLALKVVLEPLLAIALTLVFVSAAFSLLYLYFHRWQPRPEHIKNADNLSEKAAYGLLEKVIGRAAEGHAIIDALQRKQPVLLLGESGAGKSIMSHFLAQAIHLGLVTDDLKDCTVFVVHASDLLNNGFESIDKLGLLRLRIGPHEKKTILWIDEMHLLFEAPYLSVLGMRLLKLLDQKSLVHLVGTTTSDHFRSMIAAEPAINRRFCKQTIESLKDKQTLQVLQDGVLNTIGLGISDAQCQLIYTETQDKGCQPGAAKKVLDAVISKIEHPDSPKMAELQKVMKDLQEKSLMHEHIRAENPFQDQTELEREIHQANQDIEALKAEQRRVQAKQEGLNHLRQKRTELNVYTGALARRLKKDDLDADEQVKLQDFYHFLSTFGQSILHDKMEEYVQKLPEECFKVSDDIIKETALVVLAKGAA